jgi:hypothetical protein
MRNCKEWERKEGGSTVIWDIIAEISWRD